MALNKLSHDSVLRTPAINYLRGIKEEPKSLSDLAEQVDRSLSNSSNYTSKLERDGYLVKREMEGEKTKEVIITEKGRKVLELVE